MRILFATMQFGRGYAQGTERYVAMLAGGVRTRGHEAFVVAGDPERRGPARQPGEVLDEDPLVLYAPTCGWMAVNGAPVADWRTLLERLRPDVVHIANPAHIGVNLALAARAAGIPVVVTIMDFWWLCPKHTLLRDGQVCDARVTWRECLACIAADDRRGWVRSLGAVPVLRRGLLPLAYFGRAALRGGAAEVPQWKRRQAALLGLLDTANAVIFPSAAAERIIGTRLTSPRCHRIPYGLESRWFAGRKDVGQVASVGDLPSATPPAAAHPRDPTRVMLGYAGALAPHKGPHLLLEALHRLGWTGTRVRIAGGGNDDCYIARLHELARGLKVEFAGRVATEAMPDFLRALDLLILPSIWPENLPIVMLEAHAVSTPVLASDIAGVAEAVPPELRFAPGSVESLMTCLAQWLERPGAAAPPRPLSVDEMVEQTLAVHARAALCTSGADVFVSPTG
jgi:glycosyltransferase involved in cell wall biosynthesis